MKTSFKRFAALVLAAVMVLGTMHISMGATGNVSVDPQLVVSGLAEGDVAYFYQVIGWEMADSTHNGGWIYTSDFIGMSAAPNNVTVTTIIGTSPDGSDWGLTSEIAGKIARMVESGNLTGIRVPAANGEAVLDKAANGDKDVPAGMYLVLIQPANADTVYSPVFVSADFSQSNPSASWMVDSTTKTYQDKAATKKSELDIEKSASTSENNYQDKKWTTTRIGETVSFDIDTTIPGYGNVYEHPKFEMNDKLTFLKLNAGTVTLTAPSITAAPANTTFDPLATTYDYCIKEDPDGAYFTIQFTEKYLKSVDTPTAVHVKYTAVVTTDAPMNVNEEKNEVSITYSHNPSDQDDYNVKKDDTVHYTFSIDADAFFSEGNEIGGSASEIVKVGKKSDGTPIKDIKTSSWFSGNYQEGPLEGATFKLYTAEACNPSDEYIPMSKDGVTPLAALTLKSDSMGRIKITGLDAGTYWIKEESAPAGFIKDQKAHSIEIEAFTKPETVTQYWDTTNQIWYSQLSAVPQGAITKSATYTVDLLDYYTVKFDGHIAASHRFNHDNGITSSWEQGPSIEIPSSIVNTQGVELPSTGGIGTTIFYAGGAMLVLLAGVLLVSKRRIA